MANFDTEGIGYSSTTCLNLVVTSLKDHMFELDRESLFDKSDYALIFIDVIKLCQLATTDKRISLAQWKLYVKAGRAGYYWEALFVRIDASMKCGHCLRPNWFQI